MQLEKWEAAIQDYEALMQEIPGDEVVSAALLESKIQLNKLHNGHRMEADIISNFVSVSSSKQIAYFTNTPGNPLYLITIFSTSVFIYTCYFPNKFHFVNL